MAKQIIVLERTPGGTTSLRVAFWFPVQANRQVLYARAGATSAWKQASGPENAALVSGAVVERVETFDLPAGATVPQVKAALEGLYTTRKAQFDAEGALAASFYGTSFDGSAWADANLT